MQQRMMKGLLYAGWSGKVSLKPQERVTLVMSREKSIHGSQIAGRRPWDEDGVGTVQTPEEGQGG